MKTIETIYYRIEVNTAIDKCGAFDIPWTMHRQFATQADALRWMTENPMLHYRSNSGLNDWYYSLKPDQMRLVKVTELTEIIVP